MVNHSDFNIKIVIRTLVLIKKRKAKKTIAPIEKVQEKNVFLFTFYIRIQNFSTTEVII